MAQTLEYNSSVTSVTAVSVPECEVDTDVIQQLDDEPNDVGGLTAQELKEKFDEVGTDIKDYINDDLIPAIIAADATEQARAQAEAERVANEIERVSNENTRISAETTRGTNETTRQSNETTRGTNETTRQSQESTRQSNESSRQNREAQRISTENSRIYDETIRSQHETTRESNETSRANAETARVSAETSRVNAESSRVTAEESRVTAESGRVSAESARVTAEQQRASETEGIVTRATAQANLAEGYKDTASTKASEAATSASNASTSASNASTSASNASTSESNASASATSASSSASTATTKASEASTSATTASDKALVSEGWALGKQNGTDVGSGSPYYHDNAKYWCEQAQQAAGGGVTSFNGRSGSVEPVSGDYTASMVGAYSKTEDDALLANKQDKTDNTLGTTSKTVVGAINEVNNVAKGAQQALSIANYSTMVSTLNAASATAYNVGQSIYIVTLDVPDIWIASIESTSVPYTYTTDAAIVTALASGTLQIGYYKIAKLETQKVDLTNYYTQTETNSLLANKQNLITSTTATLEVASWSSSTQTVNVTGVTASNNVIISPAPSSHKNYADAQIYCSAQGDGTLTFTCETTPTSAITVNVMII